MTWANNRVLRQLRVRPRLVISAAAGLALAALLPADVVPYTVTRWLLAWNLGTTLYLLLAAQMMIRSTHSSTQRRARTQDEGQLTILLLVVVAAMASLAAIAGELAVVKSLHGWPKAAHAGLAGYTVLSSWAFIQLMFTLHYAHDYYLAIAAGRPPGLAFPQDDAPEYGDFFYFAAIIGTSGQTADVAFVTKPMRRIGSLHCILAYLFNTTVLALLINIGASLF
jgi:uncharacterized membrane protein